MAPAGGVKGTSGLQGRIPYFLGWIGTVAWFFFLPLSQAHQHIKATSIAIFVILGAFLLDVLFRGFQSRAIRPADFKLLFPLAYLALLPLLHAGHSAEAQKQLVLRAPFFALPFLLVYTLRSRPGPPKAGLVLPLVGGFALVLILLFFQGPLALFRGVRSMTDEHFWWVISRPYLGMWIGLLVFAGVAWMHRRHIKGNIHFRWLFGLGLPGLLLAFWVLAKLAFIALAACMVGFSLHSLWRNPRVFIPFVVGILSLTGWGIWQFSQSQIWADFNSYGEIRFTTVSKAYANSVNNRLILWRSAFDLVAEDGHAAGLAPESLQKELDTRVARYNGYLTSVHLNPHNQFLSMVLGYGWFGLIVWGWVWWSLFTGAFQTGKAWFWGTLFLFICCQGEVYWDREMGVQAFIVWAVFLLLDTEKKAVGPGARPGVSFEK